MMRSRSGQIAVTSKREQVVSLLERAIASGDYADGARIESENVLSGKYGISRNTVREAVSALVRQGYLSRIQGKGTFVAARRPQAAASEAYAILIHAQRHVFEAQSRALVRAFQRRGALPMVFDVDDLKTAQQTKAILCKVLDQGVAGIVLEDGLSPLLELCGSTGHKLPLLAVINRPAHTSVPVINVISDFRHGARLGTQHLLGLGRRRILFVIHRNPALAAGQRPDSVEGEYGDVVRGYTGALADAGLSAAERFFFVEQELREGTEERRQLMLSLCGPDRPDAVFAYGDYRARHVMDAAADSGLRVPADLAVLGYWNTPWAEMTRVPLSSVSIREDEIARLTVERMTDARRSGCATGGTMVVKPQLVVRESCGGRSAVGTRTRKGEA